MNSSFCSNDSGNLPSTATMNGGIVFSCIFLCFTFVYFVVFSGIQF
jgi:hypothetical protein